MFNKLFKRKCPSCNEKSIHPFMFKDGKTCKCQRCFCLIEARYVNLALPVLIVWALMQTFVDNPSLSMRLVMLSLLLYGIFGYLITLLFIPLRIKEN